MVVSIDIIKKLRDLTLAPLGDCKDALFESNGDLKEAQEILKKKGAIKADKKSDRETTAGVVKFIVDNGSLVGIKLLCETDFVAKNDSFIGLVDKLLLLLAKERNDVDFDTVSPELMDSMYAILRDNAVMIGENMKIDYVVKKAGNVYVYNHMGNTISSAIFYVGADESVAKICALQVAAMNPSFVSMLDVDPDRLSSLTDQFTKEVSDMGKSGDILSKIVEGKVNKSLQDDVLLEQVSITDPTKKIKEIFPDGFSVVNILRVSVSD